MSSAGGTQKKRKGVVRKDSADTQEYESCPLNGMEVDLSENYGEFSFVSSALSSSAGWHEPKFMCDRKYREEGFNCFDIAPVMVEDNGELHTINFCES